MASGPGKEKDQDDHIQEPVHGRGQREDSSAATSAAAADASRPLPPPPPVLPVLRHRLPPLRIRERPGDGRRRGEESSYAAAEGYWKGKKVLSPIPSLPSSRGSSPPEIFAADSGAGTSSSPAGRGLELQQVKSTQVKKTLWSKLINYSKNKILGRKGRPVSNRNSRGNLSPELPKRPHVDHQTIPFGEAFIHYFEDLKAAMREGVMPMNVVELQYSKLRPVAGDGECFYRSFIFSYLEQVLDTQDTHEEHRLLAAVERVAIQCVHLGWTSEFFRRHEGLHNWLAVVAWHHSLHLVDINSNSKFIAFRKLINKVMKWKRQGGWTGISSTNSYRKQKLLDFFSTYDTTKDIFAFLRLVAAIWICSHREVFELQISGLREHYSLKDWCLQHVIPPCELAEDVQMTALASALDVPLVVELLRAGDGKEIYASPGVPLVMVTLLFTGNHYDIIYR